MIANRIFCNNRFSGLVGAAGLALLAALPASASIVTNINIIDDAFQTPDVTIQVGDSVAWSWTGNNLHSSSSDAGDTTVWDSTIQGHGFVFTNTFSSAGSFPYHCNVHSFMHGSVVVQTAAPTNVPPSITSQPQSLTVLVGGNATFSVGASGTAPLSYQWQFGGTNINGATASSYTVVSAQFTNQGSYSVTVSNAFGVANSAAATLTVTTNAPPPPPGTNSVGKATYYGLFYDTNGVAASSSGTFKLITTGKGGFNGLLQTASAHLAFHGTNDNTGSAQGVIAKQGTSTWTLNLQFSDDQVSGTVNGGGFVAQLSGFRAVFDKRTNACPQAGKYTMVLPGDGVGASQPGGDSAFTVSIDASGKVKVSGWLGDGTHVVQNSVLSGDGQWPLFVALPAVSGELIGWVSVNADPTNNPSGRVSWIKPAKAASKFYPGGFEVQTNLIGSPYQAPPKGSPVLNLASPEMILRGSDLGQSTTNPITVKMAAYGMGQGGGSQPSVKFNSTLGTFSASVANQATGKPIRAIGVALQNANVARGYFLGITQSGQAVLQSQ